MNSDFIKCWVTTNLCDPFLIVEPRTDVIALVCDLHTKLGQSDASWEGLHVQFDHKFQLQHNTVLNLDIHQMHCKI